jgi:hypothetical protein
MADEALTKVTAKQAFDDLKALALAVGTAEPSDEEQVKPETPPRGTGRRKSSAEMLKADAPELLKESIEKQAAKQQQAEAEVDAEAADAFLGNVMAKLTTGRDAAAIRRRYFETATEPAAESPSSGAKPAPASGDSNEEFLAAFRERYQALDEVERMRLFNAITDVSVDIDVDSNPDYELPNESGVEEAVLDEDDDDEWANVPADYDSLPGWATGEATSEGEEDQ